MDELGLEPESNRPLFIYRVVVLRLLIMVDLELMQEITPSIHNFVLPHRTTIKFSCNNVLLISWLATFELNVPINI